MIKSSRQLRLIEAISNPQYDVISFDIFDTLVLRNLWLPEDVFAVLEQKPEVQAIMAGQEFAPLRHLAERELRLAAKERNPLVDPSLNEIYANFQAHSGLQAKDIQTLAKLETACELHFIAPRSAIGVIFRHAQSLGKRVILCSDMYLPRSTITALLDKCGYTNYERLYLSCELGVTKKDGALFQHVAADMGLSPDRFLHLGDNKHSDLIMAQQAGWSAMYTQSARDQIVTASTSGLRGLTPQLSKPSQVTEPATRASLGLIASKAFADHLDHNLNPIEDQQQDTLFRFGYATLGPFLLSLALWIRRQAETQGIDHVAWLARDGALPLEATRLLDSALGPVFKSTYVPISRKLLFPYFLNTPGGLEHILSIGYKPGFPVRDFVVERFGEIGLSLVSDSLKDSAPSALYGTMADYHDLVCDALRAQAGPLAEASQQRAQNLLTHYRDVISPNEKTALFDVGRKGTFQAVLSRISGQPIYGFYVTNSYDIFRNAPNRAFSSFLGVIDPQKPAKSPDTMLYEAFLSEKAPGFTGFSDTGQPERGSRDIPGAAKTFYSDLQSSALDYLRDAISLYGTQVTELEQDPFFATYSLEHWAENETAQSLLAAAPHEDPMSAAKDMSLLDYFNPGKTVTGVEFHLPQRRAAKRIALYCPAITRIRGGAEQIGARVANALHAAGYEVLVFSSGRADADRTPVYPLAHGILVRTVDTRSAEQITQLLADFAPDAGLILASGPAVIPVSLGFATNLIPYLLSERACPDHCMKTYWKGFTKHDYHMVHEAADAVAVQFPSFLRHFPDHMRNQVEVLANPIIVPTTIAQPAQRQKVILCAARIWMEQKRQHILLRAFAQIAPQHPDWRLVFYGNAYHSDKDILQSEIKQLGLTGAVDIHDATLDLQARLDEASVFVLPSAFEGFPNALAEALASGLPAIGFSSCAGVNELIENGVNGYLVQDADLQSTNKMKSATDDIAAVRLAEALSKMIGDTPFRVQAGEAAQQRMMQYQATRVLQDWLQSVARLVDTEQSRFCLPRIQALQSLAQKQSLLKTQTKPPAPLTAAVEAAQNTLVLEHTLSETAGMIQRQMHRRKGLLRRLLKRLAGRPALQPPTDPLAFIQVTLAQFPTLDVAVPASFDEPLYLKHNPDIDQAIKDKKFQNGYVHYLLYGYLENRAYHLKET